MKATILYIMILVACTSTQAQTVEEWTNQKKTQIKYLVLQIAALKQDTSVIERGYYIAEEGLDVIQSIKKGDFNLHSDYFNSLKKVNPKIKVYWKVADIIALQINMITSYKKHLHQLKGSKL